MGGSGPALPPFSANVSSCHTPLPPYVSNFQSLETAHLEAWLACVGRHRDTDYLLAVEILRCRRLIKGYSDTHTRGLSKFDRVLGGIAKVAGRADAADWARRLREAALQDEKGAALDGALATIGSFTDTADHA